MESGGDKHFRWQKKFFSSVFNRIMAVVHLPGYRILKSSCQEDERTSKVAYLKLKHVTSKITEFAKQLLRKFSSPRLSRALQISIDLRYVLVLCLLTSLWTRAACCCVCMFHNYKYENRSFRGWCEISISFIKVLSITSLPLFQAKPLLKVHNQLSEQHYQNDKKSFALCRWQISIYSKLFKL